MDEQASVVYHLSLRVQRNFDVGGINDGVYRVSERGSAGTTVVRNLAENFQLVLSSPGLTEDSWSGQ